MTVIWKARKIIDPFPRFKGLDRHNFNISINIFNYDFLCNYVIKATIWPTISNYKYIIFLEIKQLLT